MSQRKRAAKNVEKTLGKLEHGLRKRMEIRAHHQDCIGKLDIKIAASELEIEDLKAGA
jgi:hypothetical protein